MKHESEMSECIRSSLEYDRNQLQERWVMMISQVFQTKDNSYW